MADAEPVYLKSIAIYEKKLGLNHPTTALSWNNLAELYRSMGRYEEAHPLYEKAFKVVEEVSGTEHYDGMLCLRMRW